jgi:hypothetical protein
MDQQTIKLYLAKKGCSAVEILVDLVATLGLESVSYPTVVHCLRQATSATSKPNTIL